MWVRGTRAAWVEVALVRSPPTERPAVCGLAAHATLNKPSRSPLCKSQQVSAQFVSAVGPYTVESYAKRPL